MRLLISLLLAGCGTTANIAGYNENKVNYAELTIERPIGDGGCGYIGNAYEGNHQEHTVYCYKKLW